MWYRSDKKKMGHFLLMFLMSTLTLIIDAEPSCTYNQDEQHITKCEAGDSEYVLQKGLVSDNKFTTSISLRGCKLTGIASSSFDGLPRLKVLDLSDNSIDTLNPGDLDGATGVTHLNLSYNLIMSLPKGIFNQKTRLELLDLKGNQLIDLEPEIFGALTRLGYLDLSSNHFRGREMNADMFPKSNDITFMDFSGSDMTDTTENLLQAFRIISFLNLSGCALYKVPKFATQPHLSTLKHLMVINNRITKIDDPNTFNHLVNLEMINFAGNIIERLHEEVFKSLKKLRSVVFTDNKLTTIPDNLFKGMDKITDIDLSHNLIENIPVNAFRGTALKNLNLGYNRFTYLTDNFLLELANSGANVRKFQFENNPWQCACLRDVMKEVKERGVEYTDNYDGKHKQCVTTKEFTCKRQPNFNQMYIEMYFNNA